MQFQLNTDANIQGDDRLAEVAETPVAFAPGHLTPRLPRIELHLADVNGAKGGDDDIRCTMEARPGPLIPSCCPSLICTSRRHTRFRTCTLLRAARRLTPNPRASSASHPVSISF